MFACCFLSFWSKVYLYGAIRIADERLEIFQRGSKTQSTVAIILSEPLTFQPEHGTWLL